MEGCRTSIFLTWPAEQFAPARQGLGQRAFEGRAILVTNESSLSDAEDFTEGYRSLGVGLVVGVPTAGWIIFTSLGGSGTRIFVKRNRQAMRFTRSDR